MYLYTYTHINICIYKHSSINIAQSDILNVNKIKSLFTTVLHKFYFSMFLAFL